MNDYKGMCDYLRAVYYLSYTTQFSMPVFQLLLSISVSRCRRKAWVPSRLLLFSFGSLPYRLLRGQATVKPSHHFISNFLSRTRPPAQSPPRNQSLSWRTSLKTDFVNSASKYSSAGLSRDMQNFLRFDHSPRAWCCN